MRSTQYPPREPFALFISFGSRAMFALFISIGISMLIAQPTTRHNTHHHSVTIRRTAHANQRRSMFGGVWHHIRVLATAYLIVNNQDYPRHHCPVYNAHTADGDIVHVGSVAIDPRVFHFRTKMRIPGYGKGIADDTGGFINGPHIDLAMTSCRKAMEWGHPHILIAYQDPKR